MQESPRLYLGFFSILLEILAFFLVFFEERSILIFLILKYNFWRGNEKRGKKSDFFYFFGGLNYSFVCLSLAVSSSRSGREILRHSGTL